jgi:DNA-binding NarL/FixJ family response regulator
MRRDGTVLEALTPGERDVLGSSATGLHVAGVAVLLCQSPDEVRQSLASALRKLGAQSKLEAVVIAMRMGIIRLPVGPEPSDADFGR